MTTIFKLACAHRGHAKTQKGEKKMTKYLEIEEKFESDNSVKVRMMTREEIEEDFGIKKEDVDDIVVNSHGQTLPVELLVIYKNGEVNIFHAKSILSIRNILHEKYDISSLEI